MPDRGSIGDPFVLWDERWRRAFACTFLLRSRIRALPYDLVPRNASFVGVGCVCLFLRGAVRVLFPGVSYPSAGAGLQAYSSPLGQDVRQLGAKARKASIYRSRKENGKPGCLRNHTGKGLESYPPQGGKEWKEKKESNSASAC